MSGFLAERNIYLSLIIFVKAFKERNALIEMEIG